MKIPLFILAILVFAFCEPKNRPHTGANPGAEIITVFDADLESFNGKVKRLTVIEKALYSSKNISVTDFDVRGNAIQTVNKGSCHCSWKFKYQYDKDGKKTLLIAQGGGMHPEFNRREYKYDGNGRVISMSFDTKLMRTTSNDMVQKIFLYKYDADGNLTETQGYLDDERIFAQTHRYNDKHFLLVDSSSNGTTTYRYPLIDKYGNWLKRIAIPSFYDAGQADTATRKISYY